MMKTVMMGAMAALLLASTAAPALAQHGGHPDGDPRNGGGRARQGAMINRNPHHQRQEAPQLQAAPRQAEQRNGGDRDWRRDHGAQNHNRGEGRRGDDGRRDDRPGVRQWNGQRGDQTRDRADRNRGEWNRGARVHDVPRADDRRWDGRNRSGGHDRDRPRYDRRHYPPVFHSQHRYRGPVYRPPSGFYARSWVFGDIVPRGWYGSQYYIDDWWSYGLPIPPAGYEWTRIGDDAVLVDTFTGRVQVVYDLFW
jgi:Ni/Co efflux regulator RcnB